MANKLFALLLLLCLHNLPVRAQNTVQIREYEAEYKTYPFSDPNPIPVFGKTYPYFRYDGYTKEAAGVAWKVVELESDYLKIKIFPRIGGKIWSVYDKVAKQEMFYDNDVVKFRDISLRGPWTSGGIEFNYGVVGHAPACSFPVDYLVRKNPDGSASCFIGVLDLTTRSRWSVEINMPADKGWFTTRSFWHNSSDAFQPYYNWVNTGVAAEEDLNFVYPGTYVIRHDGVTFPWPMDRERNKDLSVWTENDFIGSKSYHIAGKYAPYFGTYWADDDFGMLHYAGRDEKIGRKIFSWALSDQGRIWEELLTDNKGQYVELQSGRLFNQNMVQSSLTPYKQILFTPFATDVWTEYWFPYKGTGGVSEASLLGVVHLEDRKDTLCLKFSPLQHVRDTFRFYDTDAQLVAEEPVRLSVARTVSVRIAVPSGHRIGRITLAGQDIWNDADKRLSRPLDTDPGFDWNTAYGHYLKGRDLYGLRLYDQAEVCIRRSLEADSTYVPALAGMAALYSYRMDYDSAFLYARKALSIDQYDAKANYEFGRAARQLHLYYDALDGFDLAALTTPLRSAACTELARLYLQKGEIRKAAGYAEKSLATNTFNLSGWQLLYLTKATGPAKPEAAAILEKIATLDPLSHFVRFEKYYADRTTQQRASFLENLKSEFPEQDILELVVMYHRLGMADRCKELLAVSPRLNAELLYWQAYLFRETGEAGRYLKEAKDAPVDFVFPFREESKDIFEWAMRTGDDWKPRYLLALLHASRNNADRARRLLSDVRPPDFSPFYSFRASLADSNEQKEPDLIRAVQLSPADWRYCHQLTHYYLTNRAFKQALNTIESFYPSHKAHFPTGSLYVRALICNGQYEKAERILSKTYILPFEGERGGRVLYQEIKLMLALQALEKGQAGSACRKIQEALLWPRNLGVGKPYNEVIETRLEDWLMALCLIRDGKQKLADGYWQKAASADWGFGSVNTLLQALSFCRLGNPEEGEAVYRKWEKAQKNEATRRWGKSFYEKNKEVSAPVDFENMRRIIQLISGMSDVRLF